MTRSILYIILTLILCSCAEAEKSKETLQDKTLEEISHVLNSEIPPLTKAIIVINDKSCGSCNQEFCSKMVKFINNPNCKIILSANENSLDFSGYKQPGASNVFKDKNDNLYLKGIVSTSTVFFIKNNAIDTIIEIHPEGLDEKIAYINKQLN